MAQKPASEREAAARLLEALRQDDPLSHEEAQALLPSLLEAETTGEDVDSLPQFRALLAHLDRCADCLAIYEGLSEDLAVLMSDTPLPGDSSAQLSLEPVIDREGVLLRVLRGLRRRLELSLHVPNLAPVSSGEASAVTLFAEPVPTLAGSPTLTVALDLRTQPSIRVAISEPGPQQGWQVQLLLGDQVVVASTDDRGEAVLTGFSAEQLRSAGRIEVRLIEHRGDDV